MQAQRMSRYCRSRQARRADREIASDQSCCYTFPTPMTSRALTGRIPELDGLRGIAIGLVLVQHYIVLPLNGAAMKTIPAYVARLCSLSWSGVDLFFVLSGFLIGGILLDAKNSGDYFKTFYIRRAFRILPLYAALSVAPLLLLFISPNLRDGVYVVIGYPFPWYVTALFGQNIWIAFKGWGNTVTYLGLAWSLAVEEQFYLTLPLIVRRVSVRALTSFGVVTIITAPIVRLLAARYIGPLAPYTLVFCRADALMLGVLAAILVRRSRGGDIAGKHTRAILLSAASFLGAVLLIFIKRGWGPYSFAISTAGYSVLAAFYCCLLLLAISPRENPFRSLLRCGPLMKLGSVAYCVYLVHGLILNGTYFLMTKDPPHLKHPRDLIPMLISLMLTFAVAAISWRYFEQPLIAAGHRFRYKALSIAAHSG